MLITYWCLRSRTLLCLMLCQWGGGKNPGSHKRWPEMAREIFNTTEHHAQHTNLESTGKREWLVDEDKVWHQSASGEQLNCASLVFPWVSLGLNFFLLLPSLLLIFTIILYLFQLLNCFYLKLQLLLLILLPIPPQWRGWASSCMVLSFYLVLNHDKELSQIITEYKAIFIPES